MQTSCSLVTVLANEAPVYYIYLSAPTSAAGGSLHCSPWWGGDDGGADRDTHLVKAQPTRKANRFTQC